jgi:flagellar biogenesis protein FliO
MKRRFLTLFILTLSLGLTFCYSDSASVELGSTESPLIEESHAPMEIDFNREMLKMLGALGAIIGLLFLTIYILKKVSTQRAFKAHRNASMEILERRALSPKSTLYLVEVEGKKTLIAESSVQITPLLVGKAKAAEEGEPSHEEAEGSFLSFKELFKKKASN